MSGIIWKWINKIEKDDQVVNLIVLKEKKKSWLSVIKENKTNVETCLICQQENLIISIRQISDKSKVKVIVPALISVKKKQTLIYYLFYRIILRYF